MWKCMIVCDIINNIFIDTSNTLCKIAWRICNFLLILLMLMEQTIFTKTILFDFIFSCLPFTVIRFEKVSVRPSHKTLLTEKIFFLSNRTSEKLRGKKECKMNKDSLAVLCGRHVFENEEYYQHWIVVHDFHEWNDIYLRKILIHHDFDHTIPKLYPLSLSPFEFE